MTGPIERMADEWSIRSTIERYCRHLDDRRFPSLLELFAEDAVFFTMGQELRGRRAIAEFLRADETTPLSRPHSAHLLSNCVVEVEGDEATAETDWTMIRRTPDGDIVIDLAGRYQDHLCRSGDTWRFTERRAIALARSPLA